MREKQRKPENSAKVSVGTLMFGCTCVCTCVHDWVGVCVCVCALPEVDCLFLRGERVRRWYGSAVPYKSSVDIHNRIVFCR